MKEGQLLLDLIVLILMVINELIFEQSYMEDEMPRIPRLINEGEATVYHVMSRTALDGFPLGDIEKDYLLAIIKKFAGLYFIDMLGFALIERKRGQADIS